MQHYKNLIEKKVGFVCLKFGPQLVRGFQNANLYTYQKHAQISIQMLLKVQFLTRGCKKVLGFNLNALVSEILVGSINFKSFFTYKRTF